MVTPIDTDLLFTYDSTLSNSLRHLFRRDSRKSVHNSLPPNLRETDRNWKVFLKEGTGRFVSDDGDPVIINAETKGGP